jgi:dTDP-4-dehydrorhamnose reductase
VPISSVEYAAAARRPANSLLSNEKVARELGVALPPWDEALRMCVEEAGPGARERG